MLFARQQTGSKCCKTSRAPLSTVTVILVWGIQPALSFSFTLYGDVRTNERALLFLIVTVILFWHSQTQIATLIDFDEINLLVPLALDSLNEPSSRWPDSTSVALLNLPVCLTAVFEHTGLYFVNSTLPATGLLHFFIRRPPTKASLGKKHTEPINCSELELH